MAEIVLTFALEETLKKVGLLAAEGIGLAWGFKEKLHKLNQSLESIRAVLHDAEEKQVKESSVKLWLRKLRDIAYEADDVVDEFGYEVLRQKVETTPIEKVRNFFSASSNPIAKCARKLIQKSFLGGAINQTFGASSNNGCS
ncbi:hypothetical protein Tsubulata_050826 [Turnera subulata]|uniref:Disease resistance N-terminal domain-containing protein n=1 Tax=Turnera subulata TaxID=218843 RepID=A0A9Q0FC86_9ROSI|nr:hypothetical protein Tsubulata_050826 [Turnera subulata]